MTWGRLLRLTGAIVIPAIGLWVFLKDVNPHRLVESLNSLSLTAILVSTALAVVTLWFRSLRWRLMLPQCDHASPMGLFGYVNIGFMLNNLFPARVGDASRVLILWKRNRFPASVAIGSIILERVFDTVAFMVFFSAPVLLGKSAPALRPYALAMGTASVLFVVCLLAYAAWPGVLIRLIDAFVRLLPRRFSERVKGILDGLLSTLNWLHRPTRVLAVAFLSVITPGCYSAMIYFLSAAPSPLGIGQALCATAFAALGAAIPLSPGYVGTLHASLQQGLVLLGQEREVARAVTLVYHAIGYVTTTLLGLWYFVRLDLRFREIAHAREQL